MCAQLLTMMIFPGALTMFSATEQGNAPVSGRLSVVPSWWPRACKDYSRTGDSNAC